MMIGLCIALKYAMSNEYLGHAALYMLCYENFQIWPELSSTGGILWSKSGSRALRGRIYNIYMLYCSYDLWTPHNDNVRCKCTYFCYIII